MTYNESEDGLTSNSDEYVIYVEIDEDWWKTTHHSFDTQKQATEFILSGNMRSIGKKFTIVHEVENQVPMNVYYIRENYSSIKETPKRATALGPAKSTISCRIVGT